MRPRKALVVNPYAKQSRPGGVRNGGSERGHRGSRKGVNSSKHGGKRKGSSAEFNRKKNGPSKTSCGSLMHAFGISGIGADVGREEGGEGSNDVSVEAQACEGGGDDIPISKEGPSWQSESWLQMLVGKNLGKEGHSDNHSNNMKLRTGIVE